MSNFMRVSKQVETARTVPTYFQPNNKKRLRRFLLFHLLWLQQIPETVPSSFKRIPFNIIQFNII